MFWDIICWTVFRHTPRKQVAEHSCVFSAVF